MTQVDDTPTLPTGSSKRRQHCLVTIYGPEIGRRFCLDQPMVTLGRGEESAITMLQNDISKLHCYFSIRDNGIYLRDCGSTNGTYVNGVRLRSEREIKLRSRDLIKTASVLFRFFSGEDIDQLCEKEMQRLSIMDGLTNLYNRQYLLQYLAEEMDKSWENRTSLSLVMFDVNGMQRINKTYGRSVGDAVLREVAYRVKNHVNEDSCFARSNDDEFAVAMPDLGFDDARVFEEVLCEVISQQTFKCDGNSFSISVSSGVASTDDAGTPERLIEEARNRLTSARTTRKQRTSENNADSKKPGDHKA